MRRLVHGDLARYAGYAGYVAAGWSGSRSHGGWPRQPSRLGREESAGGAHQEADERVHGMVSTTTAEDRPGESQDAQLGDLEKAR